VKPTESRDRGGKMMRAFSQNKALNFPLLFSWCIHFLTIKIYASWNTNQHSNPQVLTFKLLRKKEFLLVNEFSLLAATISSSEKNCYAQKNLKKIGSKEMK
jgi:hypothetical protein